MTNFRKIALASFVACSLLNLSTVQASEGRYQAYWNGKSYLIMDTDQGHMWAYHGDSLIYNGRIDGDDFEPPEKPKIWQQKRGNWERQK